MGQRTSHAAVTATAAVDEKDPLDDLPADLTPAKAVPRLQNMVKTLRYTNQSLTRRLENAIVQSHKILSRETDPKAFVEEFRGDGSKSQKEEIQLEVFRATKRAQDAELQQAIMTKALQFEKQRAMKLELELAQTKRMANDLQNSMAQKDNINRGSRDKLQDEIRKHSEKLEQLKDLKSKKMKALMLLTLWIRRYVLPRARSRIHNRNKDRLSHHLSGIVARKKYLEEKDKRTRSAASIQASLRGRRERTLLKKKQEKSIAIQAVWRGKKARQLREQMLIEKATAAFSKEYKASSIIRRCVTRWLLKVQERRDAAARKVQAAAGMYRKRQEAREHRRRLKDEQDRINYEKERRWNASVRIQKQYRGRLGRKEYAEAQVMKLKEVEKHMQAAREHEQMMKRKLQERELQLEQIATKRKDILAFWEERSNVTICKRPHLRDCIGFWITMNAGDLVASAWAADHTVDKPAVDRASVRFHELRSLVMQLSDMEAPARNESMEAKDPVSRNPSIELQQKFITTLDEGVDVNSSDFSDAFAYLGDHYMQTRDYNGALSAYDRAFRILKENRVCSPQIAIFHLKKLAHVAYLMGCSTQGNTKQLQPAVDYCEELLSECSTSFGPGSVEHALAQVFAINVLQEARGMNIDLMNALGDAVGVLTKELGPSDKNTLEAQEDLQAVRVLIHSNQVKEKDNRSRSKLLPLLGKVVSYDKDTRMVTACYNTTSQEKMNDPLSPRCTLQFGDFEDQVKQIPFDHPKLDWYATAMHRDMIDSGKIGAYTPSSSPSKGAREGDHGFASSPKSPRPILAPCLVTLARTMESS